MKQEICLQQLCVVEQLLRDRKFTEALDELNGIKESDLSASEHAFFCLLISEARVFLGDYDVELYLENALKTYKHTVDNDKFARAKFLKARMLIASGKHFEARESLLESYAAYKRCDNLKGCASALNRLAYISSMSGDMEHAIDLLKQSIDIYEHLNDIGNMATYSNNLALVYFLSGSLRQSISQYQSISSKVEEWADDLKCRYYLRYGLVLCHYGNSRSAKEMLADALNNCHELKHEKAQYFEYLGWIHILDGNFKEAEKALKFGLELSLKIAPESALISQTKRLLADAYFGLKKYDLAQKYAEEALVVAEKINERAEIAACYRVFAQVCLHDDKNGKAIDWFKKAIDLFAMIQSRYELAVTRYLYATSGLCDNNERIALLYMAREYFIAEEIQPYIEKVDKALASSVVPRPIPKASGDGAPVFIAVSPKTKIILDKADHFAPTDYTVLITGPTGVGKDQLAKYIHWASGRKGEYYSFNCAAFPETMIEAELFGYCAGAFTDAKRDKKSLIELAEKGTLCLNEIAETPIHFQSKLLDFLESKEIRPVGSTQFKKVDVRIIAATNQDLFAAMAAGRFRSDLYYRLKQVEIFVPSLSERAEDIMELAKYFLKVKGFDLSENDHGKKLDLLRFALSSRDWPGNVRELEYEIGTQYFLSGNNLIRLADLIKVPSLSEREILIKTLEQTGWNQREAARRLNMTEGGIRYLIKKHGLSKSSDA